MLNKRISYLVQNLTETQKKVFYKNIELWEKTALLNGRPQHFDSFEIDKIEIINAWESFIDDLQSTQFDDSIKIVSP